MRNGFGVVFVLVVIVITVGFLRGWFSLGSSNPDEGSNKVNINLTVDPDKAKADARSVKEKTHELTGKATGGAEPRDQESNSK